MKLHYLMGWLRDYLWLNSSQLINGYNPYGMNNLAVWAWMFLFGHLIWATGFMFLISWRGYWQELIETMVWAHERTPLANLVRWKDKPVALSIVQARLVGLAHFTVGYILTYAAFLIASTSSRFGYLVSSLFCLSLRTLFGGEWLIPAALALFILGVTGLMLSVALALMEFYQITLLEESTVYSGSRSFRQHRAADPRLIAPTPVVNPDGAAQSRTHMGIAS
jgi:hypothetical protein